MKQQKFIPIVSSLIISMGLTINAEASFLHSVGGVDYEWMEFSATVDQSRRDVEAQFSDTNSAMYGYRYASRTETQALLESYTGIHDIKDYYTEEKYTTYAAGMTEFFNDFGILSITDFGQVIPNQNATGDNTTFSMRHRYTSYFYYGEATECDNESWSCWGRALGFALDGNITAYETPNNWGWDASNGWQNISALSVNPYDTTASLILKDVSAVPVPAAIWLFGSGLIGLIGVSRRRKS